MKKEWNREQFINLYKDNHNPDEAVKMSNYMKNHFPFLGIKSPIRNELWKQYFAKYELPKFEQLEQEVLALYALPEREFHYAAITIYSKYIKSLQLKDLAFCETLITTNSWWDSVDSIAPTIVGTIVKEDRISGEQVMEEWINSENMWLNRAAILHQLKYKEQMNEEILFHFIKKHAENKEFFVAKAIGWVLREYAKTNPSSVISFVENNTLQPLSKREALKNIAVKN